MDVEYALITSSALPDKVRKSSSFLEVEEEQWFDLVEYSKSLDPIKDSEKVMVLVVAHGTPEQEAEERAREEAEAKEMKRLKEEEDKRNQETSEENEEKERLRKRSKEIFNALYGR